MKFKQYIPILIFVVALVLSGVSILTSKELEKRKYVPPAKTLAGGMIPAGNCPFNKGWGNCGPDANPNKGGCDADRPTTPQDVPECASIPKNYSYGCIDSGSGTTCGYWPPQENPDPSANWACLADAWTAWSTCSASCGTGTQTRTNACGTTETQSCNTQPCLTPTPTKTPTPTPTLTSTPTPTTSGTPTPTTTGTPTVTPTGTLSPTVTPTPSGSPTPTPTGQPTRRVCINNTCQVVVGAGSDECQSDVSCQPPPVTPTVPKSGSLTPTILSIVGGLGLLIGGILLAL